MSALWSGKLPFCSLEWMRVGCDATPLAVSRLQFTSNDELRPFAPDTRMWEPK